MLTITDKIGATVSRGIALADKHSSFVAGAVLAGHVALFIWLGV